MVKQFTYLLIGFFFSSFYIAAQEPVIGGFRNRIQQIGGNFGQKGAADSLSRRNKNEDSITIYFRYLDSSGMYKLDSSVNDFTRRYPVPAHHIYLGNTGNASRSLLFSPNFAAGFDPGFHAFDVYKWKTETARLFNTTRPYSEINYMLGSRVEQIIELIHTQNLNPNWNVALQYRLINSPGFFKNQKTNHNNYQLTSTFHSKNRRYHNNVIVVANKLQSAENGGILDTSDILNDPIYKDRFNIETRLGGDPAFGRDFFSTRINTGNKYNEFTFLLRQQFDIGKKDSIVTDSTIIPLFYPRLRFEHTFTFKKRNYTFQDYAADSAYYKDYYDTTISSATDTFVIRDDWREIINDFSIYQFPDAKNLNQFIKLGVMLQNITGEFASGKTSFINTAGHAEYRNRTRNQRWDIAANGKLYFTGVNAGDYEAHISLQSFAGKKLGYITLGFENTSRTPSFIFDSRSSFYLLSASRNFKKENNSHFFASYYLPSFKFRLSGNYFLLTNYTYLTDYFDLRQESTLFNVLRITAEKTIRLGKRWNWHAELYFQQVIGNAPVNVPAIYTRNRIGYEGNLGFKNLNIAMGVEIRYRPTYKADNYSPLLGQFFYQDTVSIKNNLPDIAAYIHFRIRPFKAFIRAENLNTARNLDGFSFTRNNLIAPGYALPGLQLRFGIYWSFVN